MPCVSIVTALYNKGAYIREAMDSVRAQTEADWELIVVDNGSLDNGPELVRQVQDSRITLIKCIKLGPGSARNCGVRRATSDWVIFLDADDILEPDHIERKLKAAARHPEGDIIAGCWREFPQDAPSRIVRKQPPGFPDILEGLQHFSIAFVPWAIHAAMVRRALLTEALLWPEPLDQFCAEDIAFWFRLVNSGRVAYCDGPGPFTRMATPGARTPSSTDPGWLEGIWEAVRLNEAWLADHGKAMEPQHHKALAHLFAEIADANLAHANREAGATARELAARHFQAYSVAAEHRGMKERLRRLIGPVEAVRLRRRHDDLKRKLLNAKGALGTLAFRVRYTNRGVLRRIGDMVLRIDEALRRWDFSSEAGVLEELQRLLRPGSVFVDVGANFGMQTLYAARLVGSTGAVLAFEPILDTANMLRRHILLNCLEDTVHVYQTALSNDPSDTIEMTLPTHDALGLTAVLKRPGQSGRHTTVANARLDAVLARERRRVDVIKIDVEGAELEVLRGAENTLKRDKPVLLIEVHGYALPDFGADTERLDSYLRHLSYSCRRIDQGFSLGNTYFHNIYTHCRLER